MRPRDDTAARRAAQVAAWNALWRLLLARASAKLAAMDQLLREQEWDVDA